MDTEQNGIAAPGLQPFGAPDDLTLSRTINRAVLEPPSRPMNSDAMVGTLLADLPYAKQRRLRGPVDGERARGKTEIVFNNLHRRRQQTVVVASAILLAVLAYLALTGTILESDDPVAGTPAAPRTGDTEPG